MRIEIKQRYVQLLVQFSLDIPFECASRFRMGKKSVLMVSLIRSVGDIVDMNVVERGIVTFEVKVYTRDGIELKAGFSGSDSWVHVSVPYTITDEGPDEEKAITIARNRVEAFFQELKQLIDEVCRDVDEDKA